MSYPCGQALVSMTWDPMHACDAGALSGTHLDWFPPQDEESLGSLGQESGKLVDQDVFDFVGLLDLDADAHTVDAGLDEDSLVLVSGNDQGVQQNLGGGLGFDLRDIVSFGGLGSEVGQAEGGCHAAPDTFEVGAEGLRLRDGLID